MSKQDDNPDTKCRQFLEQLAEKLGQPVPERGWFEVMIGKNGRVTKARTVSADSVVINMNELPETVDEFIVFREKYFGGVSIVNAKGEAPSRDELEALRVLLCDRLRKDYEDDIKWRDEI